MTAKLTKRGPKTVRGKITAAMNSTKHGILSPKPVVTHFETEGGWKTHRESILDSLDPANGIEQALAERVALNSWRLNRVAAYETLQLSAAQEDLVDDMRRDADKYSSLHAEEAKGFEGLDSAEWQRAVHNDVVGFYHETISELGSQHTMVWLYNQAPYYALELAAWQQNPGIDLLTISKLSLSVIIAGDPYRKKPERCPKIQTKRSRFPPSGECQTSCGRSSNRS
jgi:hypothetical protein